MQHLNNVHGISDPGNRQVASDRCRQATEPLPTNSLDPACGPFNFKLPSWEDAAVCQMNAFSVSPDAESLELDLSLSSTGDVESM
jgi:hypothetical protein